MTVLLINPPYEIERYMGRHLARVGWVMPPMGLLYVAASLEQAGFEVHVYDAQIDPRALSQVLAETRPDVVGITCTSAVVGSTLAAAELIKEHAGDVPVVVGGVHPTVRPDDMLASPHVDVAVRGEGVWTMVELARAIDARRPLEEVDGLSLRRNGRVVHTRDRALESNIDSLPFPARHHVPMERYRMSPDWSMRRPFDLVFTAFGCPYRCIFCAAQSVGGGYYRTRSIPNAMQEVDHVIQRYRLRSLLIADDSFVVSKERAHQFCELYSSRGYHKKVPWQVSCRVDTVDLEVLQAMKRAGCFLVSFGVETGVPRLLATLRKGTTVEQSERAVRLAKEAGLRVRGTFILGIPTETRQESLETIRFSRSLPLDQVRFALATPFPGTVLWNMAEAEGSLCVDDWMALSLMAGYRKGAPPYVPQGRNADELKNLQRQANLRFFLRPRTFFEYASRVRSFGDLQEYALGAWELVRASLAR